MDRTVIAPRKAEERELSEKLYKKLLGLTLLHPPTDEFRKCLNEEMFLKPNQQGFFQVMHYLFKLHDPIEFRKRFYWPITDKKAEANFRSCTIDYLKYLDERHQLHWSNIKSYLVQMPGGMKFINFLLDLVSFVVQELIKHREKHLSSDIEAGQVSDLNMKRMRKQNEFFKEYASAYNSDADRQIVKLKEKTTLIRQDLQQMAQKMKLDLVFLMDDEFAKEFESSNRELFVKKYSEPVANIIALEESLVCLKEAFENFQNKKTELQVDKDSLRSSLIKIQRLYPEKKLVDEEFQATPYNDAIKIDALISAFNVINDFIQEKLTVTNKLPRSCSFVSDELIALKTELQEIESQITDFQKKLNSQMKQRNNVLNSKKYTPDRIAIISENGNSQSNKENQLLMKYVATPPIKLEMLEGSRNTNPRLPFLDDFALNHERSIAVGAKGCMDSLNSMLALPRSARKQKNADISIDLNITANKSKIIDPMLLLRTINKESNKVTKLPSLNDRSAWGTKWKDRQYLFGKDIDATPAPTEIEFKDNENAVNNNLSDQDMQQQRPSETSISSSPYTPFNSNDRTRIARSQMQDSSGGVANAGSLLYMKKPSAVKKVQDASINFHNLSTSPSGRLDPLFTMEEKDVPKLLLNDVTILNNDLNSSGLTKTFLNLSLNASADLIENNENDLNLTNTDIKFVFNLSKDGCEDELFDISDTVLKDVTM